MWHANVCVSTQSFAYSHTHTCRAKDYQKYNVAFIQQCVQQDWLIGERERAYLVVQTARFFYIYIYLYPALMYAVMFYVILNKRKLHFPLAKNVMHSPSNDSSCQT